MAIWDNVVNLNVVYRLTIGGRQPNLSFNSDGYFRGRLKICAIKTFRSFQQAVTVLPPLVNFTLALVKINNYNKMF